MFFKKEQPGKQLRTCEKCKHLIDDLHATAIDVETYSYSFLSPNDHHTAYFCPEHMPKYSRAYIGFHGVRNYYKEFSVDEDGEPIGYVKKK